MPLNARPTPTVPPNVQLLQLRPLVEQGWQIDLTYSFAHQPTPRHVTLGVRVDVFDQPSEPILKIA